MGDWYPLALFSVCVNILFVFLHPLLVESPRWLLTKGRVTEAAEIINNIRKINNQEPVMELEEKLRPIAEQENQQERDTLGPLDIFKNLFIFRYSTWDNIVTNSQTILQRLLCLMAVIWSVNDYFYVAGSLNAENLHGDIWLNFSLQPPPPLWAHFLWVRQLNT